ncbi:hypothetical protein H0H93_006358 [Arthromyces matolae]|nr:hypothetical protein H0H93_006358 [Arthromyces matolae]
MAPTDAFHGPARSKTAGPLQLASPGRQVRKNKGQLPRRAKLLSLEQGHEDDDWPTQN